MRKLQASDNVVYRTLQAPKIPESFRHSIFPEKLQPYQDNAFLTRHLPVMSRTGRTEYQLLLMKSSEMALIEVKTSVLGN